jgi:hypothetical protein
VASTDRRLGLSGGVAFKAPCRVATTANITLNGLQTIDGVSLAQDDRVLVKNQSTASQNGIWNADSGDWTRAADFNGSRDVVQGTLVLVVSGTVSASTVYQLTTASPVIGTSSLAFAVTGTPALFYASAYIQTLLDDTTAADARTTLDVRSVAESIPATLTTAGDILSHNGSVYIRTGLGTEGQFLGVSGTAVAWQALPASPLFSGVRQTVSAGPVTTAGLPDFLGTNPSALSITTSNVSSTYPLVATAANGWSATTGAPVDEIGYSTSPLQWTGLTASRAADTPNYIYVTISAGVMTTGSTILAPIYQWGGTPATTAGQFTFNIGEMRGYLGNGTTAPQTNLVMVGEAVTDGTGVTATVEYAYNGKYESAFTATLPAAGTVITANHNIGVQPRMKELVAECTTIDLTYAVGQQISTTTGLQSADTEVVDVAMPSTRNAVAAGVINGGNWYALYADLTNRGAITRASWKYKFIAERGW